MAAWRQEAEAWCRAKHYRERTIGRLLSLSEADGQALWALLRELRLGENQLRDLWEWAEEIASRDGRSLHEVVVCEEIQTVLRRRLSRNDRLRLVRQALRRRRFPRLAAAEEDLQGLLRRASLPPEVQVRLPANLEGDEVQVVVSARNPAALRRALEAVVQWARSADCERLFALLEEAP